MFFSKISDRFTLLGKVLKVRPSSLDRFLEDGGLRLGELNLERWLSVFLPKNIPETFRELQIPLKVSATNYQTQRSAIFEEGPLRSALAASAAMPAIFLPVKRDSFYYLDGSATNPCPLDTLQGEADHIIAIDVSNGIRIVKEERPNKLDAVYASNQIMQMTIVEQIAAQHPKTILIRPPVDSFRALDFLKAKEILAQTAFLRDSVKLQLERFF